MEQLVGALTGTVGLLAGAGAAALGAFFRIQGDADVVLEPDRLELLERKRLADRLYLRCSLPLWNRGRQKGMVLEVLGRPEYLGPCMAELMVAVRASWPERNPHGYWEAVLVDPGQRLRLVLEVEVRGTPGALRRLLERPSLPLVVRYAVIGRTPMRWLVDEVAVPLMPGARPTGAGMRA